MYYYRFNSKKPKRKQHLADEKGNTICKAENGSRHMDALTKEPQRGRPICQLCQTLAKQGVKPEKSDGRKQTTQRKYRDPFLGTWEWKQVRYMALQMSDGRCGCCGRSAADGAIMNVDHIKDRRSHPELALTLSNLQVLCSWCNQGKSNRDHTDWREPKLATLMGERIGGLDE